VSGVYAMFRNRRFLRLIESYVSHVLVSMDLPVWPMYTFPHSQGIRYTPGIFRPKSSLAVLSNCLFYFIGTWTVLILYFVKSLLILFRQNVLPNYCQTSTLRTRTGMVFKTLVCSPLNHLTRLIVRENFIIFWYTQ
jgi:hypothetical protein